MARIAPNLFVTQSFRCEAMPTITSYLLITLFAESRPRSLFCQSSLFPTLLFFRGWETIRNSEFLLRADKRPIRFPIEVIERN